MYATTGGSGGIPSNSSLEAGWDEEKKLKYTRKRERIIRIQESGTRLEQEQEEREIVRQCLQKIKEHEAGKGEGVDLRVDYIPKLREKWDRMHEWIIILTGYIDGMICWDVKAMRTERIKIVIQEAAGLGEREGTEDLIITNQGSGEDYAEKVLQFLEEARRKERKEKERDEKTQWNVSAKVFSPAEDKECETINLFPRGWFKKLVMQSDKANLEEKGYTAVTSSTLPLQLRTEKGEIEQDAGERESGTFEFYPKGGLMKNVVIKNQRVTKRRCSNHKVKYLRISKEK